nr:immunoglobulin heavy chain junction region [Mus musculus]MBK4184954.1 immunoglobulin heavy chain junction region [Mus musculus]
CARSRGNPVYFDYW